MRSPLVQFLLPFLVIEQFGSCRHFLVPSAVYRIKKNAIGVVSVARLLTKCSELVYFDLIGNATVSALAALESFGFFCNALTLTSLVPCIALLCTLVFRLYVGDITVDVHAAQLPLAVAYRDSDYSGICVQCVGCSIVLCGRSGRGAVPRVSKAHTLREFE
ncbi:hypothetical protein Tco_1005020 [Tanacetum coccineum]|uniref:Secreted protein n=1 Tax=Tanacetum coccineum TaxID=301880 RepID=A0ABQ5FE09_9ASTR